MTEPHHIRFTRPARGEVCITDEFGAMAEAAVDLGVPLVVCYAFTVPGKGEPQFARIALRGFADGTLALLVGQLLGAGKDGALGAAELREIAAKATALAETAVRP